MPAHIRITDLNTAQCRALVAMGDDVVVSVDTETKSAVLKGTISQAIAGIQHFLDEIREKDGVKAQNYRIGVSVRNRLDTERDAAEKGKSDTVEIVPNGASIEGEVPKVLAGVPVVKNSGPAAKAAPVMVRTEKGKGVNTKPALPLAPSMRHNFLDLAKNANTPSAREYWLNKVDELPAEPTQLFA